MRTLQTIVAAHLALSVAYMYYFCRNFGLSSRLAILNLAAVTGAIIMLVFLAGLVVLSGQRRSKLLGRRIVGALFAAWSIMLAFLYLAHFVGYRLWGNTVNYKILFHYLFRRRILGDDAVSLPLSAYLTFAIAVLVAVTTYSMLSGKLLQNLEELFLPQRASSVFQGRRGTWKLALTTALLAILYCAYLYKVPTFLIDEWSAELEPIASFFQPDLCDMGHPRAIAERLRIEEPRARSGYPSGQVFRKRNVVLIIVDDLRADHMGIYGYGRPTTPFLSSLAGSGALRKVEFATSTCSLSACGILSTLSSKTLPAIIPEDFKLHDLLYDQGYKTYFILSGDHDWQGLKKAYGPELTMYADSNTSKNYRGLADDRLVLDTLGNVPKSDGTPAFFYFHLMSVHLSGVKHEENRVYLPAQIARNWGAALHDEYDVASLTNYYDNGVVQADRIISQIFDLLRSKGYLDGSIGVILSDHGEGLGERGPRDFGHGWWLYPAYIRIPLLIYDTSDRRFVNLRYATQIDVAPTIVDELGLQIPVGWQGQSMLRPDVRLYTFHQTTIIRPTYAVLYRPNNAVYEYVYRTRDLSEELYELSTDPTAVHNVINSAEPSVLNAVRKQLKEYRGH